MDKKPLIVVSLCAVVLLVMGSLSNVVGYQTVQTIDDNDLVEVTTQACGIQGYGNTTVKLTRQQYNDLEQYLVEFKARLNQTTTREEAIPLFKEAVVELDKYGLLPKGMSVEKAQRLISGWEYNEFESVLNKRQREVYNLSENVLCLLFLSGTKNMSHYPDVFFGVVGPLYLFTLLTFILICPSPYSFFYSHFPKLCNMIFGTLFYLNDKIPLRFLANVIVLGDGDCSSIGFNGIVHSNNHDYFIQGFAGLTLRLSIDEVFVLGFARKFVSG